MIRRPLLLPSIGILLLLVGCSCDDEKAGWSSRTIGGLQSETLTIGDHTRVTVTESVSFTEGSNLVLSGQVEFLMSANTSLELPADFSVPANAGVTFRPADATPWQKLKVSQAQVDLRNLTIRGAIIGLDLSGSGAATLSRLTISECEQYGLYAVSLDSLIIEDSRISNCVSDGAHIKFSKTRLSGVSVTGCAFHGVYLLSGQSLLEDCTLANNGLTENGSGITVDGTDSAYSITHSLFD
ncbi:MAG: right-handed parallel beta-helix repeat-containing protein, partial [Calditrichaeota bacterium]|nr:right-handed parallel beta-helix repeat-containing protein [Calditrichota bacterium]